MPEFNEVGDFCPNEVCPDYGQRQTATQRNIVKNGKSKAGHQRYLCRTCGKTFTATHGTIFYRRRTPEAAIIEVLALLAEGSRVSSVSRVKGYKEDTILEWLRAAGAHAEKIAAELMATYQVTRGQIDGLWAYAGHKGEKKAILKRSNTANSGARP